MVKHRFLLALDTCGCTLRFETDDKKPDKTVATIITKCPEHIELSDKQAARYAWEQNQHKNRTLAEIHEDIGSPKEGPQEYVETWFTGKGDKRKLHLKFKKGKLSRTHKQAVRKKLKNKDVILDN